MPTKKRWSRAISRLVRQQNGVGLAEVLVSVAIVGSAVIALLSSMTTGANAVQITDEHVSARYLAESQLEYIKAYPYEPGAATYPLVDIPTRHNFTMVVSVVIPQASCLTGDTFLGAEIPNSEDSLQQITVTVLQNGGTVTSLTTFKGNR